MTSQPRVYAMFERPERPARPQVVTLRVPVPSRRDVSWVLLLVALACALVCAFGLDARWTPALLLSLAPWALGGLLATAALLTIQRDRLSEYVDRGGAA
ncbi:hypothetical protein [Deinococcus radiotolerans]|uniref:Uncharacterized protein n=1 Tax=Deinococcus radiotolerans TaxID=1309407 RepID=A0ABQ2FQ27_9DEIO|nr:hypothetical protein [Deinococcus radiotolerans]GGL15533.1 hypothetical protein GCM10010844_38020 [Deinococcus radiotolerans]